MAGIYSEIELSVPGSVPEGVTVLVLAKVKNTWSAGFNAKAIAQYDGIAIPLEPLWQGVWPNQIVEFYGQFNMPPGNVLVSAQSLYWTGEWVFDDEDFKEILLEVPVAFRSFGIADYARR